MMLSQQNPQVWQQIPAGIAALLAVILVVSSDAWLAMLLAFVLVLVEFVLGYAKHKTHGELVLKNTHTESQVNELETEMPRCQHSTHSLQMIGTSNLPIWAHQIGDCISISTSEMDDLTQIFSSIVGDLHAIVNKETQQDELSIGELKQRLASISSA